jgi:tetratricopeptide (TPR) repeat protein
MFKRIVSNTLLLGFAAGSLLIAQTANPKQPKPKSQKEVEAINAVFNATAPDARIAAVEDLVTKFADTEFKSTALYLATDAAAQKNDVAKLLIYGDRTLQADPQHFGAMLTMARALAQTTREFDLDKEEKLTRADKLANEALALIPKAVKPRAEIPDDQWEAVKKDFNAQAFEVKGMVALTRKNYSGAIEALKTAYDTQPQKDPTTMVRLAAAYADGGKPDEAIALCDQISAMPDVPPVVKQLAGQTKLKAATAKAAK